MPESPMRTSLAAACCLTLAACGGAQDKPKEEKKGLSIGDKAPPLAVTKWLAGAPVKAYESGKVYVIEFWATWCGPCIEAMPHLGGLQAEYKDQGLVVLGVTTRDNNNTQDKVEKFVEKRGKRYGYGFAWCADDKTYEAYMTAAGEEGIPCSFVVDKAGKVAFIGHPSELDDVLPKVLAGTWRGVEDIKVLQEKNKIANDEMKKLFANLDKDPAGVVTGLAEYARRYPEKARQDLFQLRVVAAKMKASRLDDARTSTETLLKLGAERSNAELLGYIASLWASKELNPASKHQDLAEKAVEAILKLDGEDDVNALVTAAQTYQALGRADKALTYLNKAIKVADDPRLKAKLEETAQDLKKK